LLLEHNADISIKNIDKMTPMRCAQHEGRKDMVEFLTEWISKKPKRERKTRELLNNKKEKVIKKRAFKEDTDDDFKPEMSKDNNKKNNNNSKNRSASKTNNKDNDKGKIKNKRKNGDKDNQ